MYRIEKYWNHRGLRCTVLMTDAGSRCGYVGVQEEHPLFGSDYNSHSECLVSAFEDVKEQAIGKRGIIPLICGDEKTVSPEIFFDVHGSITFSSKTPTDIYPVPTDVPTWWFGYDCSHSGDGKDLNVLSPERRKREEEFPVEGIVRTLEYCTDECNCLANQLLKVSKSGS